MPTSSPGFATGEKLNAPISAGNVAVTMLQISNIAWELKRELKFDPSNGHILDDPRSHARVGHANTRRAGRRISSLSRVSPENAGTKYQRKYGTDHLDEENRFPAVNLCRPAQSLRLLCYRPSRSAVFAAVAAAYCHRPFGLGWPVTPSAISDRAQMIAFMKQLNLSRAKCQRRQRPSSHGPAERRRKRSQIMLRRASSSMPRASSTSKRTMTETFAASSSTASSGRVR